MKRLYSYRKRYRHCLQIFNTQETTSLQFIQYAEPEDFARMLKFDKDAKHMYMIFFKPAEILLLNYWRLHTLARCIDSSEII